MRTLFIFGIILFSIISVNSQYYQIRYHYQSPQQIITPFSIRLRRNVPLIECFQPRGLRASLADMPELKSVRFEISNCRGCSQEPKEIEKPTNGRWVLADENAQPIIGDQMHFKIFCKTNDFHNYMLDHSYTVENLIPAPQDYSFPSGKPSETKVTECPEQKIPDDLCPCNQNVELHGRFGSESIGITNYTKSNSNDLTTTTAIPTTTTTIMSTTTTRPITTPRTTPATTKTTTVATSTTTSTTAAPNSSNKSGITITSSANDLDRKLSDTKAEIELLRQLLEKATKKLGDNNIKFSDN